jgi:ribosomal protein L23
VQACFRTTPEVTKNELTEFFQKVYGVPVLRVDTVIVQGRLRSVTDPKTKKSRTVKESDFKKAWLQFAPGRIAAIDYVVGTTSR